ncbi:MAG TPA: hypothetical protein VED46_14680 [Alphaproteobacteria bacterium]|nr:hypothetical protein [Alphaproteobacteria bacterium]
MTREKLIRLIARAIRRSFTFASETQALGAADTVLRDLKAARIRIFSPRPEPSAGPALRQPPGGSADRLDHRDDLTGQDE